MLAYADTGFLCSLYARDAHSARAVARMKTQDLPLPITWLHALEFRNALRLRVSRGEITEANRDASMNAFLSDFASRTLVHVEPDVGSVGMESERLSALHTQSLGTRSLDILHVAAALVLGTPEFLSFDHRQRQLAEVMGLGVPTI